MQFFRSLRMLAAGALAVAAVPVLAATMAMPTVSVSSPSMGQTITSPDIHVAVRTADFTLECRDVGKPGTSGQGHVHAMLDGMTMAQLSNFYCSRRFTISGAGLRPGKHRLAVVLASDSHADIGKPAMVSFNFQPSAAVALPASSSGGTPTVRIISPRRGASTNKKFALRLAVDNFTLSCDAEGKRDQPGVGHLHVFVKQAGVTDKAPAMSKMSESGGGSMSGGGMSGGSMSEGGAMSMVGMIGMPCTKTVPVDLSTWRSGRATIVVMLAGNDHMPVMGTHPASVTIDLK